MNKQFVIVPIGGIGDWLVCTPAIKALKEKYPDHRIVIYKSKRSYKNMVAVLANNPDVHAVRLLNWITLMRYPRDLFMTLCDVYNRFFRPRQKEWFRMNKAKYFEMHFQHIAPTIIYQKSVKEIIPEILGLRVKNARIQLFTTPDEDRHAIAMLAPYRYPVIMHIHSNSSDNHHWDMSNWRALVRELPQYSFIQVGSPKEPYVEGAIDWRGKTSLREVFCLLKHAASFVGVDSSMSHATNAFDTPGVVLFGDSSPVYWGHPNNINIYKKLPCSPCYYVLAGGACPYDTQCMKEITVEDVKQALVTQITSRSRHEHTPVKAALSLA
jgi:ADP-heptose:LPS heptosyltransferase